MDSPDRIGSVRQTSRVDSSLTTRLLDKVCTVKLDAIYVIILTLTRVCGIPVTAPAGCEPV
jgi:hypothetical protein